MNIQARDINAADYATICGFAQSPQELFYLAPFAQFPWVVDEFAKTLPDRLSNTVFTQDNNIIGFANFYNVEPGQQSFIGNVVVDKKYRGQGLGKGIIQHMLKTGFDVHQFKQVHLSCFSTNTIALLMYRKLDFKPYEIEQRSDHNNMPIALINFLFSRIQYYEQNPAINSPGKTA